MNNISVLNQPTRHSRGRISGYSMKFEEVLGPLARLTTPSTQRHLVAVAHVGTGTKIKR
jgi:hypothetical protein